MRASQMVDRLQNLIEKHGDLYVEFLDSVQGGTDIDQIEVAFNFYGHELFMAKTDGQGRTDE